jgi:phosphatidylglycerophosphatase A
MPKPSADHIFKNPIHFIATGFGSGLLPYAPGTWGSIIGILVYLLMTELTIIPYLILVLIFFIAGIYICGKTADDWDEHDHPAIVWDEIAAFPIVMFSIPLSWYSLLIGFILFRVFDVWKPGPLRWINDNLSGGIGIMLDDTLAAILSLIVLKLLTLLI